MSTPDTQPGFWDVNKPASGGNSYISLVSRGNLGPYANTVEDIHQELSVPYKKGLCYELSIDLSKSPSYGHDTWEYGYISYHTPVVLRVWGGYESCGKDELLWQSPPIDHAEWISYNFIIHPIDDIEFIMLQVFYSEEHEFSYFGHMIIDNIKEKNLSETITQSIEVEFEEYYSIQAGDGLSYTWFPETQISCTDCADPVVFIDKVIDYTVTITDDNGCSRDEVYRFKVILRVPDAFSPNGDGLNDYLVIRGLLPGTSLEIFNRWGNLVYSHENYDNTWNGSGLPEGVYFYVLHNEKFRLNKAGSIHLLR